MSTPSLPPFPTEPAPPTPKPRRLRRFLFASALLVTGGVIGAVIAGPVRSQGWYGPPMHHGWVLRTMRWAGTACSSLADRARRRSARLGGRCFERAEAEDQRDHAEGRRRYLRAARQASRGPQATGRDAGGADGRPRQTGSAARRPDETGRDRDQARCRRGRRYRRGAHASAARRPRTAGSSAGSAGAAARWSARSSPRKRGSRVPSETPWMPACAGMSGEPEFLLPLVPPRRSRCGAAPQR